MIRLPFLAYANDSFSFPFDPAKARALLDELAGVHLTPLAAFQFLKDVARVQTGATH